MKNSWQSALSKTVLCYVVTWILQYSRGSFADLLRWLCHPCIQFWGSLGQVQNEGNAGQACLLITWILNLLYLMLKSYDFKTVIRLCSCLTNRQMSVWEVAWQSRRASVRWLFPVEGLWPQGVLERHCLGLTGAWYCPFREILHLLNLLPSPFWSVLLYCRMKCLIQF